MILFLVFNVVLAIYSLKIFLVFLLGSVGYVGWTLFFLKRRAELDFKRFDELHQKGFISAADIERRKAQLMVARARFEVTADQLGMMTLRAIESGRISAILVKEGTAVAPGQTVARVAISQSVNNEGHLSVFSCNATRHPVSVLRRYLLSKQLY
jgi:multidrug resistance efflux pump